MNWPRAIYDEGKRTAQMTFGAMLAGERGSWIQDRHLLKGYFLGLLAFVPGVAIFFLIRPKLIWIIPILFPFAIAANLIWFGYAAWSRNKEASLDRSN
jgi:hypothetical protein